MITFMSKVNFLLQVAKKIESEAMKCGTQSNLYYSSCTENWEGSLSTEYII